MRLGVVEYLDVNEEEDSLIAITMKEVSVIDVFL